MDLRQNNTLNVAPTANYSKALEEDLRSRKTDYASSSLKAEAQRVIDDKARGVYSLTELTEHRPPLDKLGFREGPAIPQRTEGFLLCSSVYTQQFILLMAPGSQSPCQGLTSLGFHVPSLCDAVALIAAASYGEACLSRRLRYMPDQRT